MLSSCDLGFLEPKAIYVDLEANQETGNDSKDGENSETIEDESETEEESKESEAGENSEDSETIEDETGAEKETEESEAGENNEDSEAVEVEAATDVEEETDENEAGENSEDTEAVEVETATDIEEESEESEAGENDEDSEAVEIEADTDVEEETEENETGENSEDSEAVEVETATDVEEETEENEAGENNEDSETVETEVDVEEESEEREGTEELETEVEDYSEEVVVSDEVIEEMPEKKRLWSFLVYMPADNNLEAAAIEDMLEMEYSSLDTDLYSVFVLMDRNASYDTSDSNWTGSKLFQLQTGRAESSKTFISCELECQDLNLSPGENTELDMSSSYVLSDCLNFVMKKYPAENYGFIMWGHGTGWRNSDTDVLSDTYDSCLYKGFAFDESSGTYMTLSQLKAGLERGLGENKLSFLGFDTCFGASVEVMYELRNTCDYAVGSEGLLMSSGWNYKTLFNAFNSSRSSTGEDFALITLNKFQNWYENSKGASFSVIKMDSIEEYFSSFDNLMAGFAENIYSRSVRDEVMGILYSNIYCETEKYTYGSKNSDVYLDIDSMVEQLSLYFTSSSNLVTLINKYETARTNSIIGSWTSSGTRGGLSVYFSSLSDGSLLAVSHPAKYIKGKTVQQIDFVSQSQGYVPSIANNDSFLGKLFYKSF